MTLRFGLLSLSLCGALLIAGCPGAAVIDSHPKLPKPDSGTPVTPTDSGTPDSGTPDAGVPDSGTPDGGEVPDDPKLPLLHNLSGASKAHIQGLTRQALNGLGFTGDAAPSPDDRVFAGRHYLAWIDQTGFYGKLNGVWVLNGKVGDALDFVLKDPDGRPVNFLAPGENGDGRWLSAYKGGEHMEFPSRVAEANDANCTPGRDWCNQYGFNEAPPIENPKIPWWSACNAGRMGFKVKMEPVYAQVRPASVELVYEGPLVKIADGDNTYDGDACNADYLFPDGVRRRVLLQAGYQLYANERYLDRTLQLINPMGNPQLKGDMSLIGGFVVTQWPSPHYLKALSRYWRPESTPVSLKWGAATVSLQAAAWNDLSRQPASEGDVLISWAGQPFTLSASRSYLAGSSATVDHVGPDNPEDNKDVGVCLCSVHGGLEMGGGLLHADKALPIGPGQVSIVARRRFTLHNDGAPAMVRSFTYEAESAPLQHAIGRKDADGWSANTADDAMGRLSFGPYATDWGGGTVQATFYLMIDNNSSDRLEVATLDIYDATTDVVLFSRKLYRNEFRKTNAYEAFVVNVDLQGASGHRMEARVDWTDISYMRLDKVVVKTAAIP